MASRTSQLIVELLDRVSGPARRVSDALGRVRRSAGESAGGSVTDRLNGALEQTNARLEAARAGVLDAVGAFYALRAGIAAPVTAAMQLESAMADVRKVVDFASEADASAFTAELLELTKTLPLTVEGLAQIAAAAGQAGIAKEDIIAFTDAAARVGVAFDISADQAGDALAKMMTGLGMTLPEVVSLSDAMNHLSNSQASSAAEILDVVRRVGAMGKQYGFTAEETAAFGSAMIASGAQADVAATSFMNMGRALTRGSSATARQRGALKALGLEAEDVARRMQQDATGTTVEVMERIAALPAEMRAAVSSDLFGDEARALGPLLTNLDLVRESLGMVGDESEYAGSAFKEFDVRAKTFQNRMVLFRNALARVGIVIGTALLPPLTDLMDRLEPIADAVGQWISQNPKLVAGIVSAAAAVIAFKGAVAALRFVGLLGASGALSLLAAGMSTIGAAAAGAMRGAGAMIALQNALMPGGRLPDGFAGPTRQLRGLSRVMVGLRGALSAVPGVGLLSSVLGGLGKAAGIVAASLAGISAPVWGAIAVGVGAVAYVGAQVWKHWDKISAAFSGVARRIGEELAPAIEVIRPLLDWLAPVGDLIAASWEKAKAKLSGFWDWLGGLFARDVLTDEQKAEWESSGYDMADRLINGIKSALGGLIQMGRDMIQSLWDGAVEKFNELLAWFRELPARIIEAIGNIDLSNVIKWPSMPSWLGGGSVTAANNPAGEFEGLEARAKGGPIRQGQPYLVGEEGPELITPTRDGFVHPADETRRMLSGGSRGASGSSARQVTLNLGGVSVYAAPGMSEREIVAEAVRQIEDKIGAALRGVQADTGMEAYG